MSIEEENKAIIRRNMEEVYNKGDISVLDEIMSPDIVIHSGLGEIKGSETYKQVHSQTRKAFPDFHFTIDDMVAEGDMVAVRLTLTGTHKGEFMGIPPTGKKIKGDWALFYRFAGGKEVEVWEYTDSLAFFQQLGVSPPSQ